MISDPVKMAGYWPVKFFCMTKLRPINMQKKNGTIPATLTKQACSVKDYYMKKGVGHHFLAGHIGQDSAIFLAHLVHLRAGFGSSYLITELAIIL